MSERGAPGAGPATAGDILTGMRTLANLKALPNWLEARLNTSYKDIYKAKLKGDTKAQAKAERELTHWRTKAGLE